MLTKTMRLNYLLDFYHMLLTPKQQTYMGMYYYDDFSLVEIAEETDVSRQAVYDNIKRTETILESYEDKLRLYEKFKQRAALLDTLEELLADDHISKVDDIIRQLRELG